MDIRSLLQWIRGHRPLWMVWCGLLLINLAGYLLFIRNEASDIRRLQTSYQQHRREMATQLRARTRHQQWVATNDALTAFWGAIGPESHFPERLRQFKNLADASPLEIDRLAFTPKRLEALGVWRYETPLTARGDYGQIKRLLADIQNLEGLFCLDTLALTQAANGGPAMLKAKVTIYLTDPEEGS